MDPSSGSCCGPHSATVPAKFFCCPEPDKRGVAFRVSYAASLQRLCCTLWTASATPQSAVVRKSLRSYMAAPPVAFHPQSRCCAVLTSCSPLGLSTDKLVTPFSSDPCKTIRSAHFFCRTCHTITR